MSANLQTRWALIERFKAVLAEAMEDRRARDELVDTPSGPELGWVLHERGVMAAEVNRVRAEFGQPPADPALVLSAERSACGHVDYHQKYALYCTEVALGEAPWVKRGTNPWDC